MKTQVTATFVSGMLKPDEHLPLAEHTRVNLTIEPIADRTESAVAWQSLKERIKRRPVHAGGNHFTRDQLHERR
jgi:hypothetical protein